MSQHERAKAGTPVTPKIVDEELQKLARTCITDCYARLSDLLDFDQQDASSRHPDLWYREMLYVTREATDLLMHVSQRLAIMGVLENNISRKMAAHLIGVHQGTVARWVKEPSQQHHGENGPSLRDPELEHAADLHFYTTKKAYSIIEAESIDKSDKR